MNKIEARLDKSDYEGYPSFVNFFIDHTWLDERLDLLYPGNMYKGLIPTLVYGMEEDEQRVVWERILPADNQSSLCPILMCPDDYDFSCTLVVAEVRNYGSFIQWARMGIDRTKEGEAEKVGTHVDWFDHVSALNFEKSDYLAMIANFKSQFDMDKSQVDDQNQTAIENKRV